jgi:hypothetical protein
MVVCMLVYSGKFTLHMSEDAIMIVSDLSEWHSSIAGSEAKLQTSSCLLAAHRVLDHTILCRVCLGHRL